MTFPYGKNCKYGTPRKIFDEFIDVEFEGYTFKAFKEYDMYLSMIYGDYMTPLPPEEREPYPVSKMKLIDVDV